MAEGVHDVASGGLGLALAEMAVQSGVGFEVAGIAGPGALFSEAPSRVVLSVAADEVEVVRGRAQGAGVGLLELGVAGGGRLVVEGLVDLSLAEASSAWRDRLPDALGRGATQG